MGGSGTIVTSSDGTTWTPRTSGTLSAFKGVAYGNSAFVAVGQIGAIVTSSDAINWTQTYGASTSINLETVAYGNGTFVTVGDSGVIITSTDGASWTPRTTGIPNQLFGVTSKQ